MKVTGCQAGRPTVSARVLSRDCVGTLVAAATVSYSKPNVCIRAVALQIIEKSKATEFDEEGCLSFPKLYADVEVCWCACVCVYVCMCRQLCIH